MNEIFMKTLAVFLAFGFWSFCFALACLASMVYIHMLETRERKAAEEFTAREKALIKAVNDERRAQIRQWKEDEARQSYLDDRTAASFDKLEETSSAADQDR